MSDTWKWKHAAWTVVHDVLAHPVCGLLWVINQPLLNRLGYWLHDVTLPDAWQRDDNDRRVPAE